MGAILEYKCPCCSGPLQFDTDAQKMKCPYCDNEFDAETLKSNDDILKEEKPDMMDWSSQPGNEWMQGELEGQKVYLCNSCGGQIVCDDTTGATDCPYCGSPVVMVGQFAGDKRPDIIIPFKLDKEAAKNGFKQHLCKKRLLPKAFRTDSYIDDIKGVYVPFWLYDGSAYADVRYHATRVHSYTEGNDRVTRTEHYGVRRAGSVKFEKIPVDASKKMPDEYMDAVEPYNYDELKPFSTAYLPGYLADKYDVSADECSKRADERAVNTAVSLMAESVMGYTTCVEENKNVSVRRGKVSYALMPVWMLSTKWNGKNYLFAMNGQTGRLIGDLPISKGKFFAWFAGIAVPLMAVMALLFG